MDSYNDWELITGLSGHTVGVAGHHHPLEVDGLGPLAVGFLCDHDVAVEVDPAVHHLHHHYHHDYHHHHHRHLQRLLPHGLAVDIEHYLVPEHPEVELVPVVVKHLDIT